MCGIAGVMGGGDHGGRRRRVRVMAEALRHRGPDDDGAWSDDDIALGFRRLAVIDLETGQQPIVLEDGSAVLVLNGEIYNYRELRAELEGRGVSFRSSGDVEVAARLLAADGPAAAARLDGMFAFAWYDRWRRVLTLGRDRHGIKPLFVCHEEGVMGFASEVQGLMAGGFPRSARLDPVALRHVLAFGYPPTGRTLIAGIEEVAPGTLLQIAADGTRTRRDFWTAPAAKEQPPSFNDAATALRTALESSVRRQLLADVPIGVFLSGGLDSSTLAALVCREVGDTVQTFSVGFEGPGAVSELPAARQVARALATDHHELMMDPATVARDLEAILGDLDGPLADPTAIPTWYMSKLARESATVALSGEGADEVFGGYQRQRFDVAIDRLGGIGRRLLPMALRVAGRRPSPRLVNRLAMPAGISRQLDWGRVLAPDMVDQMITGTDEEAMLAPHRELGDRWASVAARDPLNARLLGDRELFLAANLLPKVDRMSMAHSLEVRVPYLGDEVVDLMLPLPGRFKADIRRDKRLLRAIATEVLPRDVATRPKRGFEVPIGAWLRGPLRPALDERLSAAELRRGGVLRADPVTAMVAEHLAGHADHGRALWTVLVLQSFIVRTAMTG